MARVKDILINDDISFKDGDLVVDESDAQHIEHILTAKPGHFYQFPTLGVGFLDQIKASVDKPALKQSIKQNLEADNYRINKIEVGGNIDQLITSIDAIRLK